MSSYTSMNHILKKKEWHHTRLYVSCHDLYSSHMYVWSCVIVCIHSCEVSDFFFWNGTFPTKKYSPYLQSVSMCHRMWFWIMMFSFFFWNGTFPNQKNIQPLLAECDHVSLYVFMNHVQFFEGIEFVPPPTHSLYLRSKLWRYSCRSWGTKLFMIF